MDRRRFLNNVLSAAAVGAIAPAAFYSRPSFAGDPAEFANGLARYPWLAGWRNVSAESFGPTAATVEGQIPKGLVGSLYRNGPALFERNGFRYEHWFDGDGMVHRWNIENARIQHRTTMVATPKFVRERKAGRFLMPAAGTTVPNALPIRNNDDLNTADTSVVMLGDRLFALWEAGSAFELNPDTLATLGAKTWRDDLSAAPFSAHPLRDRDGTYWNFGALGLVGGAGLLIWHLTAAGQLIDAHVLDCPAPGYLHSFAMTDQHLVFMLIPYRMGETGALFERMQFQPREASHIAVVPKGTPNKARWFEADFAAAFHFGDAHERNDKIVMSVVRHTDPDKFKSPMQAAMRGHLEKEPSEQCLSMLHLDLRSGRAHWEHSEIFGVEFPMFDSRTPGNRAAKLYAALTEGKAPYANAIMALNMDSGRRDIHRYDEGVLVEEHLFVPKPGSDRVDEGWLIGTLLDTRKKRSGLAVLDAQRVQEGPLFHAWLPYAFPLGFHGTFSSGGT